MNNLTDLTINELRWYIDQFGNDAVIKWHDTNSLHLENGMHGSLVDTMYP